MVAGLLTGTGIEVDLHSAAGIVGLIRHQEVIDPQSAVSTETTRAKVPPGEVRAFRLELPEGIAKPQAHDGCQSIPLGL